jgi:MFS family permease
MIAFTFGGALMQMPLGRLSDRIDRRWIIMGVSVAAALAGLALADFGGVRREITLALAAVMGVTALPLYGLTVAHANDRLPRADFVEASATLLLLNALASILGPVIAAIAMARAGSAALFVFTAITHGALALFVIIRIRIKEAPPDETREPFAPLPAHASPGALELDPRGPEAVETN